jgi:hypothetical protein
MFQTIAEVCVMAIILMMFVIIVIIDEDSEYTGKAIVGVIVLFVVATISGALAAGLS